MQYIWSNISQAIHFPHKDMLRLNSSICFWPFAASWILAHQPPFCPWNFPGRNTGAGCHFLLQSIFLIQGLNPSLLCLLLWQADSLPLCHLGSHPQYLWRWSYLEVESLWILPSLDAAKSLQSCLTRCNPIDGSPSGSSVPGILQARILEQVAISFSNAWKWKVKVKAFSHVQLLETPWTVAYQARPSMEFSRQVCWNGSPLPSPQV